MKPKAIVCDLDGTLCDTKWREHFVTGEKKNWMAFYTGIPYDPIRLDVLARLIEKWVETNATVVFVTGRSYEHLEATNAWLEKLVFADSPLYMRAVGDHRPDTEVKKELFASVAERYQIVLAFEDRPHVADMIEELGIKCERV